MATQRRRQIMTAVMESIAEEGVERTTMRSVARRAGVSTGTLAYYFSDKKQLVDAALLDAAEQYMERFRQARHRSSPAALENLVELFLAADNADAAFILQMIEAGLHNSELRSAHQAMVDGGRELIEGSLQVGIETGRYRPDINTELAAALLHGVLIWWGSELIWGATSEDFARRVGRFALSLLEIDSHPKAAPHHAKASTVDAVRALLAADPALDAAAAGKLADAVELLYSLAADRPAQ